MTKFYIYTCLLVALGVTSNALPGIIQMRINREPKNVPNYDTVVLPTVGPIYSAKATTLPDKGLIPLGVPHFGQENEQNSYFAYPFKNVDGTYESSHEDTQSNEHHFYSDKESIPVVAYGPEAETPNVADVAEPDDVFVNPAEITEGNYYPYEADTSAEESQFNHGDENNPGEAFGYKVKIPQVHDASGPVNYFARPVENKDGSYIRIEDYAPGATQQFYPVRESIPFKASSPKEHIIHAANVVKPDNYPSFNGEYLDGTYGPYEAGAPTAEKHNFHDEEIIPVYTFGGKVEIPYVRPNYYPVYPVENFDATNSLYGDDTPPEERHIFRDEEIIPVGAFVPSQEIPHPVDIRGPYYRYDYPIEKLDKSDGTYETDEDDIQQDQETAHRPKQIFAVPVEGRVPGERFISNEQFFHTLYEQGLDQYFRHPFEMVGDPADSYDFAANDILPEEEYMYHDDALIPVRVVDSEEELPHPLDVLAIHHRFLYPKETPNFNDDEYESMEEYQFEPELQNEPEPAYPYEEFVNPREKSDHHEWARIQHVPEIIPARMFADHHLKNRAKRGAQLLYPLGTNLLVRGLEAVRHLTSGTREVFSAGHLQEYEKAGGFYKALTDFHSVRPNKVKEFQTPNGVYGIKGLVGDRKIVLTRRNADGMPLMEITKIKTLKTRIRGQIQDVPEVSTVERIVYNKKIPTNEDDYLY